MSPTNKLFSFVESIAFTSSAYAANTLASFTVYTESFKEYKEASDNLKLSPGPSAKTLAERIKRLLLTNSNASYMHEYDAPIAVYAYLIYQLSPKVFRDEIINLDLPLNMWWAKQMISVLKKSLNTSSTTVYSQNPLNVLSTNNGIDRKVSFYSNPANELEIVRI